MLFFPCYRPFFFVLVFLTLSLLAVGSVCIAMNSQIDEVKHSLNPLRGIYNTEVTPSLLIVCGSALLVAGVLLLIQSVVRYSVLYPDNPVTSGLTSQMKNEIKGMLSPEAGLPTSTPTPSSKKEVKGKTLSKPQVKQKGRLVTRPTRRPRATGPGRGPGTVPDRRPRATGPGRRPGTIPDRRPTTRSRQRSKAVRDQRPTTRSRQRSKTAPDRRPTTRIRQRSKAVPDRRPTTRPGRRLISSPPRRQMTDSDERKSPSPIPRRSSRGTRDSQDDKKIIRAREIKVWEKPAADDA